MKRHCSTGEPCALKGASTVRRGAVGNVPAMVTRWPPTLLRVHRIQFSSENDLSYALLDENDHPISVVPDFMQHLRARGFSPNTLSAYCYDLLHFMTFLKERQLTYQEFSPPHAVAFLEYLSTLPSRRQARRLGLVLSTTTSEGPPPPACRLRR